MDKIEFGQFLVDNISGAQWKSGRKVILFRCPFCGDSTKSNKSAHFYILLNPEQPNRAIGYYCHKCHESGLLTNSLLMEWGIYSSYWGIELTKFHKEVINSSENYEFRDRKIYRLYNDKVNDNELSRYKLNYINNRLGLHLTYDDMFRLKISLNIGDLLDLNHITTYTRDVRILQQLDRNFIGFISRDNAFITLRNLDIGPVDKSIDGRYIVYNIFNKFNNSQRYYTIPCEVDLNNPNRISLHIAEGPFDILSVYFNLRKQEGHSIYTSIGGSSYFNLVKEFITKDRLNYISLHIYPDSDISDYEIYRTTEYCKIYSIPVYIHRNLIGKDMGESIDKIKESIIQLA